MRRREATRRRGFVTLLDFSQQYPTSAKESGVIFPIHPRHLGDDNDIVKGEIVRSLAPGEEWAVHPLYFDRRESRLTLVFADNQRDNFWAKHRRINAMRPVSGGGTRFIAEGMCRPGWCHCGFPWTGNWSRRLPISWGRGQRCRAGVLRAAVVSVSGAGG